MNFDEWLSCFRRRANAQETERAKCLMGWMDQRNTSKHRAAFDALLEIQEDVSQLHFSQTAVLVAVPG